MVKKGGARPVLSLLRRRSAGFDSLLSKVKQIAFLNAALQQILSTPLKEHILVTGFNEGEISVAASSAVWASQLRLMNNDILFQFQIIQRIDVKSVRALILPALFLPQKETKRRRPLPLSPESGELLEQLANNIQDDSLKLALISLAKNRK